MEIILNPNRGNLSEGRTYGIGFAFCKVEPNRIEGVDAISTCKDYLNDFVWSEKFKIDSKKIHGYQHEYVGFFENKKHHTSMLISILDSPVEKSTMLSNYKNIESLLNSFEEILNIKYKTRIKRIDENLYLIQFSKYWVQETALISVFSLLCRIAYLYPEYSTISELKSVILVGSSTMKIKISYTIKNLATVIEKLPLIQNFNFTNKNTEISSIHNRGALSKEFKNYLINYV